MRLVELLEPVIQIAHGAGQIIADIYASGEFEAKQKGDDTPVTTADLAANDFIMQALAQLPVQYPIQSEESEPLPLAQRIHWSRYWLIDPLDGTGEFIQRSGEFAVNIALIEQGKPMMGVIYAPLSGVTYAAVGGECVFKRSANGQQTTLQTRSLTEPTVTQLRFAISRRQPLALLTQCLTRTVDAEFIPRGSSTLKSCMVAEGSADCYVRIGPTGEWDTGAAECIVREAGGAIISTQCQPLSYNQRESLGNPNFMVVADKYYDWATLIHDDDNRLD